MIRILLMNRINKNSKWFTLHCIAGKDIFINDIKELLTDKESGTVSDYIILDFGAECCGHNLHIIDRDFIQVHEDFDHIIEVQRNIEKWNSKGSMNKFAALLEKYTLDFVLETDPDAFTFNTDIFSYEELAEEYFANHYSNEKTANELRPYIDFKILGEDIADRENGFISNYGYIYQVN